MRALVSTAVFGSHGSWYVLRVTIDRCSTWRGSSLLVGALLALACGSGAGSTEPTVGVASAGEGSGDVVDTDTREQVFLYELSLDPPEGCAASDRRVMRVRGYRLGFAGGADDDGATATLVPIRGDGTVPGLVYEVDAACLAALDAALGPRGYERTTIHVEPMSPWHGGETTPVFAYVRTRDVEAAPSERYIGALRQAWEAAGLDTDAIGDALR